MKTFTLELPALYGDHHVQEVRRIIHELAGVDSVYASSCFRIVEVQFDEGLVSEEQIRSALEVAGYLGDLAVSVEVRAAVDQPDGQKPFFRHSTSYQQTRRVISFSQEVPEAQRALWPCPGIGPIAATRKEGSDGQEA